MPSKSKKTKKAARKGRRHFASVHTGEEAAMDLGNENADREAEVKTKGDSSDDSSSSSSEYHSSGSEVEKPPPEVEVPVVEPVDVEEVAAEPVDAVDEAEVAVVEPADVKEEVADAADEAEVAVVEPVDVKEEVADAVEDAPAPEPEPAAAMQGPEPEVAAPMQGVPVALEEEEKDLGVSVAPKEEQVVEISESPEGVEQVQGASASQMGRRTSWLSCCGLFDAFLRSDR